MRKRYVIVLLAAAALGGGFAGLVSGAPSSKAATPGCQAAGSGLVCASVDTPAGALDLDVLKRVAEADQPVIVWTQSTSDPAEDWEMVQVGNETTPLYAGLTDKLALVPGKTVMLEYAPLGVLSGYCVSVITSSEYARAALRPCDVQTVANQTYNAYQDFVQVAAGDADGTSFYALENVLTGFALTDPRNGAAGTAVVSAPVDASGFAADQLWEPNG